MPKIHFDYRNLPATAKKYGRGYAFQSVPRTQFDAFTASVLGINDVSREGEYVQALAAIFDLEGFTAFCNQVDSHLVIPEFLAAYLDWIFDDLKAKFFESKVKGRVKVWGSLPFYAKFMGDGLLFLWDTAVHPTHNNSIAVAAALEAVTRDYVSEFLPSIQRRVSNAPSRLRCGVARGQIVSVGNGDDYVGSCINIAARLQKLGGLTFAVSRRGFDLSSWKAMVLKKVELRGIGRDELVYVKSRELQMLSKRDQRLFAEPGQVAQTHADPADA